MTDFETDFQYFDIIKYLQSRHIYYDTEGRNVSEGWIGMRCVFPGCSDHSNHLGIDLTTKQVSCWMCGKKSLLDLVLMIDKASVKQAFDTIKHFSYTQSLTTQKETLTERHKLTDTAFELPSEAKAELFDLQRDYLTSRGLDAQFIFNKYKLRSIGPVSTTYCNRILIPYYYKNRLLTFSTRDATGQTNTYKHCPKKLSIQSPKELLYNSDTVKDTIVIVEGAFIVFKLGGGVVATSGIKWTISQAYLCYLLSPKRAFILFDAEKKAQEQAESLASTLSCVINHVEVMRLDKGDLDNLNESEVQAFRKDVFRKIYY